MSITIRLAQPDEGLVIGACVTQWGGPAYDWLDWTHAAPFWLIGEVDGHIAGVIMSNPGIPFGRVEFLCVNPALPQSEKAILCRDLSYAAVASCAAYGAQAVISNIDACDATWKTIAEKRGWVMMGSGHYMMKRCA